MKCRAKYAVKPWVSRKLRNVVSSPSSARRRRAARWKRGISVSIRRYAGRARLRPVGNRPAAPSAPAHSRPVASSRVDIDISLSWVATPSSAKIRSSVG